MPVSLAFTHTHTPTKPKPTASLSLFFPVLADCKTVTVFLVNCKTPDYYLQYTLFYTRFTSFYYILIFFFSLLFATSLFNYAFRIVFGCWIFRMCQIRIPIFNWRTYVRHATTYGQRWDERQKVKHNIQYKWKQNKGLTPLNVAVSIYIYSFFLYQ